MAKKILNEISDQEVRGVNQYVEVLSGLVAKYEGALYTKIKVSGVDVLKQLIEEHGLTQSELPEIGVQPNVSAILTGTRVLSWAQAKALGKRFNLEPAVFMQEA
jgi:HTH-type transcriptional regulator/antitoxin HigA